MAENESESAAIARIDERTRDIVVSISDMKLKFDKMENCIYRVNNDKPSWGTFRWILGILVATIIGAFSYSASIDCKVSDISRKVIVLEQKHAPTNFGGR